MKLAGRANWWAPRWLRRFHLRFGIFESDPIAILDLEQDLPDDGSDLARLRGEPATSAEAATAANTASDAST